LVVAGTAMLWGAGLPTRKAALHRMPTTLISKSLSRRGNHRNQVANGCPAITAIVYEGPRLGSA
jgi:hypothetical protein